MKLRLLVRRVMALFQRRRYERELEDDITAHLELAERDAIAAGMSPDAARRDARLRFGGIDQMKEIHRDRRSASHIGSWVKDIRYAARSLMRAGGFTLVAVPVLTLAIGASTATFSIVDAVVLRPLPFPEPDRLAAVLEINPARPAASEYYGWTTMQTFLDWRREQRSFEAISAVANASFRSQADSGEPVEVLGQRVSHEFFSVLRAVPELGRTFNSDEEGDGQPRIVVLSHAFWQRRFGGAADIVGRPIELNDQVWTIVGVLADRFAYPVGAAKPSDLYVPLQLRDSDRIRGSGRNYNWLVIGRLLPGVSMEQASQDMARVTAGLDASFPKWFEGRRAQAGPLAGYFVRNARLWMLVLLGSALLVLTAACANVASLMLARATTRAREMSIRAALGASRGQLMRGLMIEGLLLSFVATGLGVCFAYAGISTIVAWLPANLPRIASIALDLRVLGVAGLASVITGVAFSVIPAFQSSRPNVNAALRDGGRSMTSHLATRLRSSLVVAQVALAALLLAGATLFLGSFLKWMDTDLGFEHRRVIVLSVSPRVNPAELANATAKGPSFVAALFSDLAKRREPYVRDIMASISKVPGVLAVAAVNGGVPLTGGYRQSVITLPDRELRDGDTEVDQRQVTSSYLQLLQIPLLHGRYLTDADGNDEVQAAVVNEYAARTYWPGRRAIGERFDFKIGRYVVVGVVRDIRHLGPEIAARPEIYVPIKDWAGAQLVVRTAGNAAAALPGVKSAVWAAAPDQLLSGDIFTIERHFDRLVAQRRFSMALLCVLCLLAMMIAIVGVYAVMAYVVAQRRQEIGVRMALGARPLTIVSSVLRRATVLVGSGLALGLAGAWYAGAFVRSFLFMVAPDDPRVFLAVTVVLGLSGLAACVSPARRAARVDPVIALRND